MVRKIKYGRSKRKMNSYDEKLFEVSKHHDEMVIKIKNNPDLSKEGKLKALEALNSKTKTDFMDIKNQVEAHINDLKVTIEGLQNKDTKKKLTSEELEEEKRNTELMISRIATARDADQLVELAKQAAASDPMAFQRAYSEIINQLDNLVPAGSASSFDPWSHEPQQKGVPGRAKYFAEMGGLYDGAVTATVTPEAVELMGKVEEVKGSLAALEGNISLADRLEHKIKPITNWPSK